MTTSILCHLRRHSLSAGGCLALAAIAAVAAIGFVPSARASRHYARELRPMSAAAVRAELHSPAAIARARVRMRAADRRAGAAIASGMHWVASWAASPQPPHPHGPSQDGFRDVTLRSIVYTSVGGAMVRIRLTNAFGSEPLRVEAAAIAVEQRGALIAAGTSRPLTFAGSRSVVIKPGYDAVSDPVRLAARPLQKLAISLFMPLATGPATGHSDAEQLNYLAAGDHAYASGPAGFTTEIGSWYFLDSVDVLAPRRVLGAVVALGDSVTDGFHSGTDANARWPNDLARRLDALHGPTLGVVDEGISGNRVLNPSVCCGVSAIGRFAFDVLARAGVREVILLEGLNDIGFGHLSGSGTAPHTRVSARALIAGDREIIAAAHRAGLRIFGGTLTPFEGASYWTAAGESERDAVNRWILTSGAFDGVIDFATVLAEPGHPHRLNPAFDSGDHLHPDAAGYRAMADAVDLSLLLRR